MFALYSQIYFKGIKRKHTLLCLPKHLFLCPLFLFSYPKSHITSLQPETLPSAPYSVSLLTFFYLKISSSRFNSRSVFLLYILRWQFFFKTCQRFYSPSPDFHSFWCEVYYYLNPFSLASCKVFSVFVFHSLTMMRLSVLSFPFILFGIHWVY